MAVITFMSDFGMGDHYVAAVKAAIISRSPQQMIVDISHSIRSYDIAQASNVLKHVYKDFPAGTVHLVSVDSMKEKSEPIAMKMDGHYFVGFDCGLFSLISTSKPDEVVTLSQGDSTFLAKDVLSKAAMEIIEGKSLSQIGAPLGQIMELYARQLKVTKREIAGNVVHVDGYGNLITNIARSEFEHMLSLNGAGVRFRIGFGREAFSEVHSYFTEVESGDCYVLFNSTDYLQIGINKGNASELLGLGIDSPVNIEFAN